MEIWASPTRKSLLHRVPIMVVAAALASAPVLIKPLPYLPVHYLTGELIPRLRDSFSGWMTAPYLFFLVNTIIIAILAMSKIQHNLDWTEHHAYPQDHLQGRVKEIKLPNETGEGEEEELQRRVKEIRLPNETGEGEEEEEQEESQRKVKEISLPNERGEEEDGGCVPKEPEMCTKSAFYVMPPSTETRESAENLGFSVHGEDKIFSVARSTSPRSEGKKMGQSLKVSHGEKDREETLESVWKKISEGRRPPLARQLRSAPQGTGNGRVRKAEGTEESALQMVLARGRSGGSTGEEELNKRVEAFIANFNRDTKLQKQDSLLGYADMINRGAI